MYFPAVERFPVSEHERELNTNSIERARGQQSASATSTNHNREVIFALPSLRLHFKTEHLQGVSTPDLSSPEKPSVQCSFITEFEDHIFVTVDADAFFFLHDLITSYLKEKERVVSSAAVRLQDDYFNLECLSFTVGAAEHTLIVPEPLGVADWGRRQENRYGERSSRRKQRCRCIIGL